MANNQALKITEEHLQYCKTDREREIIRARIAVGSNRGTAKALGANETVIRTVVDRIYARSSASGYAPSHDLMHHAAPGQVLKGASTLYDENGDIRLQWVKTSASDEHRQEVWQAIFDAFKEGIKPEKPIKAPIKSGSADKINCYIITDYHLGMKAWHEETGDDWDTSIAEDLLVGWFGAAIQQAPKAQTAIFAQLGDFLHWDGMDAVTPTSRHLLDADTRFQKVVRVAIRAIRRIISMMLSKYDSIHVIMAEGNHDTASSVWLREWLHALYDNEPRITVDTSPDPYYCYEHGKTALFFHHGHKRKPSNIDHVFAKKFREVFGRTKHCYGHMGHLHHVDIKETNLMIIEQHRTLASNDAYASRGGWLSGRSADVITYDKTHGQIGRLTISPEMVDV